MKKSKILLVSAITLLSAACMNGYAQIAMNRTRLSPEDLSVLDSRIPIVTSDFENQKVMKNFAKSYSDATSVEWSSLADQSLLCQFIMNKITYRAFYKQDGQWIGTVSGYDGSKLNRDIIEKVENEYNNYRIVFVNQIDLANGSTIYIVEMQDDKSIIKLRAEKNVDDLEIIREFENNKEVTCKCEWL